MGNGPEQGPHIHSKGSTFLKRQGSCSALGYRRSHENDPPRRVQPAKGVYTHQE